MGSGGLCAKCHQDLGGEACLRQVTHRDRQNQHTEGRLLYASPGYLWWDWDNITTVVNNVFCSWIKMVCLWGCQEEQSGLSPGLQARGPSLYSAGSSAWGITVTDQQAAVAVNTHVRREKERFLAWTTEAETKETLEMHTQDWGKVGITPFTANVVLSMLLWAVTLYPQASKNYSQVKFID